MLFRSTGTLTSKTIYLNGGAIQSNNWVNGSTGWRIDGYGNADFNTVMVRTGNIQTNAVTKMAGGATSVLSFNGTTNGPTSIKYISCDGGDLFIQFSVRLQATGSWAGSSTVGIYTSSVLFSLYVNYSLVDSAKLTADVSAGSAGFEPGGSSAVLTYYYPNVGTQTVSYWVDWS